MFCCCEEERIKPGAFTGFPGNNCTTIAYAPIVHPTELPPPQQPASFYQQPQQPTTNGLIDRVYVTVPPGVVAGQAINIVAPDGSGRMLSAVVPQGLSAGSTFMVQFPPPATATAVAAEPTLVIASPSITDEYYHKLSSYPQPQPPQQPEYSAVVEPKVEALAYSASVPTTTATAYPINADQPQLQWPQATVGTYGQQQLQQQQQQAIGVAPLEAANYYYNEPQPPQVPQAFLQPYQEPYTSSFSAPTPTPLMPAGQKLLLVRVPPGTPPGATLKVAVPEEPGRFLTVSVPANVSEFHVAYQPWNNRSVTSSNPGYTSYNDNYDNNTANNSNNNNSNSNNNNATTNRSSYYDAAPQDTSLLSGLGGAFIGAAAMSIFDRISNQQREEDNNGANDDDGDDDAGDNDEDDDNRGSYEDDNDGDYDDDNDDDDGGGYSD